MTPQQAFDLYPRVAIAGGPRVGKTTLANSVSDRVVIHTDSLMALSWDLVPGRLISKTSKLERFIVEGVQVPRALRRGMVVDAVIWMALPMVVRSPQQVAMAKSVARVFRDWEKANQGRIPIVRG